MSCHDLFGKAAGHSANFRCAAPRLASGVRACRGMSWHLAAALLGLGLAVAGYVSHAYGVDMRISGWIYTHYSGFPRDRFFLKAVMHDGVRNIVAGIFILLGAMVAFDIFSPRVWMEKHRHSLHVFLICAAVFIGGVAALKSVTAPACPWDMAAFGGVRQAITYADVFRTESFGNGRCFPAGHSTSGYVWLGLPFVFGLQGRSFAVVVLSVLPAGLSLSAVQILRGAHFLSHELTTLGIALVVFSVLPFLFSRRFFVSRLTESSDVF